MTLEDAVGSTADIYLELLVLNTQTATTTGKKKTNQTYQIAENVAHKSVRDDVP